MRTISAASLLSSVLLVACGGDDGGSGPVIVTPDAPPISANCTVEASLGTVSPAQQQAIYGANSMTMQNDYQLFAAINADATPDIFALEIYSGYGAFTSGYPAGATTVQLTGAETGYDSCGACVLIYSDLNQQAQTTGPTYLANAGSVNFTSISTTSLAGTLSNVTLRHVDINEQSLATTDNASGCNTTISSLAFTATPMMQMQRTAPDGTTMLGQRWKLQIQR